MSGTGSRIAILLSGRGSNFAAIHEAIRSGELDASIAVVISSREDAPGLELARSWGYPAISLSHRAFPSRGAHEAAVIFEVERSKAELVVLAGYMRLLSDAFIARFPYRILNIHPSLLPAFPGTDAQAQAIAHGVKIAGCTVHFVDTTLDGGPIIVQRAVTVEPTDTAASLAARILEQEHLAYVEALRIIVSGSYRIEGRRVLTTEKSG